MKLNYITPETSVFDTRLRVPVLLAGSKTDVMMSINSVTVEDYHNGFGPDNGFGVTDFETISFE